MDTTPARPRLLDFAQPDLTRHEGDKMRSQTASLDNPLAFIGIALAAGIAAFAGEPTNTDIAFITTATQGGMAEVELSKLAVDSGNSPAVRSFAEQMVADHSRNNLELAAIATRDKILMPTDLDAAHAALSKDLANLHGVDFDRRYIQAMQKDHHQMAEFLKTSQTSVSDNRLTEFIKATLPVVEAHARMADQLKAE
jgi:putative membrane protein